MLAATDTIKGLMKKRRKQPIPSEPPKLVRQNAHYFGVNELQSISKEERKECQEKIRSLGYAALGYIAFLLWNKKSEIQQPPQPPQPQPASSWYDRFANYVDEEYRDFM